MPTPEEQDAATAPPDAAEATEADKRDTVIRLAFGGSRECYDEFRRAVRDAVPST
jgi:hypothetical protein